MRLHPLAALLLFGCVDAAAPPAVPAEPADPNEDSWTPQAPVEAWWKEPTACPDGSKLVGEPPPKGNNIECVDASGKRHGRSSVWFGSGHAGTLTEYDAGVPDGRWLYWLHGQKLIEGQHVDGRRHGKWTFWFDDAGSFDTRARMATHDWSKNYVVEEYDHGLLLSTTKYKDGKKVE
jgi:hypothetical protein